MALYYSNGSETTEFSGEQMHQALEQTLAQLQRSDRVLIVPPDASRLHSRAGELTQIAYRLLGKRLHAVLPALGTHAPMSDAGIARMFGAVPRSLFHVHDWRNDTVTLGEVPASFVHEQSEGKLNYAWPAQVNRLIALGADDVPFDLILSIGQVVPHEVIGMANYNKNILVGTGGVEGIDRSHYLGAVYGMERIMGRADTPVRRVLNYAANHYLGGLPIVYLLTVVGRNEAGVLVLRGLFIGDDAECFEHASALALKVNFEVLDREIQKAVVYLDPQEFHSTWLGNKAVYRTRMALADDAELVVLAPGVREFGEDAGIDRLIRRYGYCGTEAALENVQSQADLSLHLSAAAHLIHGSTEGRFRITYCPGALTQQEIESVHYGYAGLQGMMERYNPASMQDGWNDIDGEEVFFVANPGLGLWAHSSRLQGAL